MAEVVAIGKGHWHGRYLAEVDDQTVEARGDKDDTVKSGLRKDVPVFP